MTDHVTEGTLTTGPLASSEPLDAAGLWHHSVHVACRIIRLCDSVNNIV